MDNRLISSSSTSSGTDNYLKINIYHINKPRIKEEFLDIKYKGKTIDIGVSCISNLNNNENMNDIIQNLINIQNFKNCYKNDTINKNPLDDFLILIIVQFLFEFRRLLFFSNIKENYKYKVKIISYDRFKDWNVESKVYNYKQIYTKFVPIFNFPIINPDFKNSVEQSINNLYKEIQDFLKNDTNLPIQSYIKNKNRG